MVAICNKSVVDNAVNTVSDQLISQYKNYVTGASSVKGPDYVKVLYENTALFNNFIHIPYVQEMITPITYPRIAERIAKNSFVTPFEVESLVKESLVLQPETMFDGVYDKDTVTEFRVVSRTPPTVTTGDVPVVGVGRPDIDYGDLVVFIPDERAVQVILNEYEYYIGGTFKSDPALSSFCDMVPSIFEKIQRVTDVFNGFKKLVGIVSSGFGFLKDKIAGKSFSQLQDTVTSHVKRTFEREMKRLEAFKIDLVVKYKKMSARVAGKIRGLLDDARDFFTAENMQNIQDRIKAQIEYVLDFFKEPDMEEIQFIIYRFCTLLTTLNGVFESKISPLKRIIQAYDETNLALSDYGTYKTAQAIRAGAYRVDPAILTANRENYTNQLVQVSEQVGSNYNPSAIEITAEELDGVTQWNNGNGDSRISFRGQWVTILGSIGWTKVDPRVRIMIMQVQKEFGKPLIINSGYRPEPYNTSVGGEDGSKHISGLALDVTWNGFGGSSSSEAQRFRSICSQKGFKGFGKYNTFMHVDIGDKREW